MLERDLVAVLEEAELLRLDLTQPEVVEDRSLRVLVDDPLTVALLGDADFASVERADRVLDRHRTSRKIEAARSHSSSEGTRASRA